MKKTFLTLTLAAAASIASAQVSTPTVNPMIVGVADQANTLGQLSSATQVAASKHAMLTQSASDREYLQAILTQLVQLNIAASQAKQIAPTCNYDDKSYSEGAIRQIGKTVLVCVERDWGIREFNIDKQAPRELVWEPVNSPRLSTYRQATGLGQGK